jgi:hypothetical protein
MIETGGRNMAVPGSFYGNLRTFIIYFVIAPWYNFDHTVGCRHLPGV